MSRRAVLQVSIPESMLGGSGAAPDAQDDEDTCYICKNAFCSDIDGDGGCARSMTHLGCCTQAICCGCMLRGSKKCGCQASGECEQVISFCPFCRDISPASALDVFRGYKKACAACKAGDDDPPPAAEPARPAENVNVDQ